MLFNLQTLKTFEIQNQKSAARIYFIASLVIGTLIQVIMKQASQPIFQILYERGAIIVVSGWMFRYWTGSKQQFYPKETKNLLFLWFSVIALAISQPLIFLAVRLISIAEVLVISLSNTLWSQFFAFLLLSEKLTLTRFRNISISIVGIVLISRPPLLFGVRTEQQYHLLGCTFALSSSFLQAISYITVRIFGTSVGSDVTVHYYHFSCVIVSSVANIVLDTMVQYTPKYLMQITALCLISYSCHYLQYKAMGMISYAELAPLAFTQVLTSFLFDIFLFGTIPEPLSIIGGLIVSLSIYLSFR